MPRPLAVQFLKRPVIYPEGICEQSFVILIFRPAEQRGESGVFLYNRAASTVDDLCPFLYGKGTGGAQIVPNFRRENPIINVNH